MAPKSCPTCQAVPTQARYAPCACVSGCACPSCGEEAGPCCPRPARGWIKDAGVWWKWRDRCSRCDTRRCLTGAQVNPGTTSVSVERRVFIIVVDSCAAVTVVNTLGCVSPLTPDFVKTCYVAVIRRPSGRKRSRHVVSCRRCRDTTPGFHRPRPSDAAAGEDGRQLFLLCLWSTP